MKSGSIRWRLTLAIGTTALIPLIAAILLASSMMRQTSARFFVPEIGARLDQSLELYRELARAVKARMRSEADTLAAQEPLRSAVEKGDAAAAEAALKGLFPRYPGLVELTVVTREGRTLAGVNRGRPVDETRENELRVERPLVGGGLPGTAPSTVARGEDSKDPAQAERETARGETGDDDEEAVGPKLVAVFAEPRARFDELETMSQFVDAYRNVERRREADETAYLYAFAALLGLTMLAAVGVGGYLAASVGRRIRHLAAAIRPVGAGDLSVRVAETGRDEVTRLAQAFNRMLDELEANRSRIEYLQRIGAWQEMARRLAHEIKNPLTPIQLAMQELHRRYSGDDARFRKLLNSSLEIVEDEVQTLRRLVTEFSDFARLPQALLERADLADFLAEQFQRASLPEFEVDAADDVSLEVELPKRPAPVYLDRQMLRRALTNLTENAKQALREAGTRGARLKLSASRQEDWYLIHVDDNGPGIPENLRSSVFDPYVTTKASGTGLGLAIVKKIVMEHGGGVLALPSPLGGARLQLTLPVADTPAGEAARSASRWLPSTTQTDALLPTAEPS
jgi:nitrogen fixation/metabolism regulation signal transduction histidine kinase